AYGIGLSTLRASREQSVEAPLDEALADVERLSAALSRDAADELAAQGVERGDIRSSVVLHLRYEATDVALPVPQGSLDDMRHAFEAVHKQRFGFTSPEKRIVLAHVEVEAEGAGESAAVSNDTASSKPAEPIGRTRFYSQGAWRDASIWERESLASGQ